MFEGIKKIMKEWSEVWQPAYDDISAWADLKDIGKFSEKTIKECQEAWATVPLSMQKDLYKVFIKLKKLLPDTVLIQMLKAYLESIGVTF